MSAGKPLASRTEQIREALRAALNIKFVEVTDESHLHLGHEGARSGMGHFHVKVVAFEFTELSLITRHRLIYDAVGKLMKTDIHALSIDAISPDEQID